MNVSALPRSSSERLDYGHPLEFGYFLTPDAGDPLGVLETARLLDALGYDLVGVQDHPYQARHLDTSSLLAAILAQTTSLRVFAAVGNLPLRPPAVFAKAAATLDLLSGGRFELGLGAGGFLEAAHAMGAPALTHGESLAALEEGVAVMRAMWSGERRGLRFDGRHYQLAGVHPGPAPAHPIQIWIGANAPRALALTGRVADGWVTPLMNYKPPREAAQGNLAIDRAAREAGRDPREIRRIFLIPGCLYEHEPGSRNGHRPVDRRPTRPLGRSSHPLRARPRVRYVRARRPARPRHAHDLHRGRRPDGARTGRRAASRPGGPRRMTVPVFEDRPETVRGRMLYQSLLAVHALIRRDLTTVERLAAAVQDGLPAEDVHEELGELKRNGMLWQFQVSCLSYCGFVHMHHNAEDREFFDELEETNPAIRPVVERLRADHRKVSDHLDAVEAAARALSEDESQPARRAVADALEVLEGDLLAHLEYEELNIAGTARRLPDLPWMGPTSG